METINIDKKENLQRRYNYAESSHQYTSSNLKRIRTKEKINKMLFRLCLVVSFLLGVAVVVLYTVS